MSGMAAKSHLIERTSCGVARCARYDTRISNFDSRGNDVRRREMLNKRESQYHHFHFRDLSSFLLACSVCILFEIIRVDKKWRCEIQSQCEQALLPTLDSLSDHHRRLQILPSPSTARNGSQSIPLSLQWCGRNFSPTLHTNMGVGRGAGIWKF